MKRFRIREMAVILTLLAAVLAYGLLTQPWSPPDQKASKALSILDRFSDPDPAYAQAKQIVSPVLFSGATSKVMNGVTVAVSDPIALWNSKEFALATDITTEGTYTGMKIEFLPATSYAGTYYTNVRRGGTLATANVLAWTMTADTYIFVPNSYEDILCPYWKIRLTTLTPAHTVEFAGSLIHR